MEHVKVRNQRAIGNCYAHVAAQIYDAWRFLNGDQEFHYSSSGLEINQRFKSDLREKSIHAGHLTQIFPKLMSEGTCAQEELDSLLVGPTIDEYASKVMEIYEKHVRAYRDETNFNSVPSAPLISFLGSEETALPPAVSDQTHVSRSSTLSRIKGHRMSERLLLGLEEFKKYHDQVVRVDLRIPFDRLLSKASLNSVDLFEWVSIAECPEQRRIRVRKELELNEVSNFFRSPLSTAQLEKSVDSEFSKGLGRALPIAIGYCSSVLEKGRSFRKEDQKAVDCGRHASLIVGNRIDPRTKKKQYLIRNTWGNACQYYSRDWSCEPQSGSVWVDVETLAFATDSIQIPVAR